MKHIRYTLVDNKTNNPVSQAPARNGPKHPEGVVPTFDIQSTYASGVPDIYGIAEDDYIPEDWMQEVPEEDFYIIMREEFKSRASARRREVERGGYWINPEMFVRTDEDSQNRLAQLATTINNDPELQSVDFEFVPGQWATIDTDTALMIGRTVSRHVQRCFSWCKEVHESLDAANTLEEILPIVQSISSFVADDNPPAQTEE
jgi:hypothetical protein